MKSLLTLVCLVLFILTAHAQVTSFETRTDNVVLQASDVNHVGNLNLVGKIGMNVPNPFAKLHSSDTGVSGTVIPIIRAEVPNFSVASWQVNVLPVDGVGQRKYTVMKIGWNCDRSNPDEPSWCRVIESDYQPHDDERWMEIYDEYQGAGPNGVVVRQNGATMDKVTDRVVDAVWRGSKLVWTDDRNNMLMLGHAGEFGSDLTWGSPTNRIQFKMDTNDIAVFQQRSSTGGFLSLPFYDSMNRLRVGDGASGVEIKTNLSLNTDGPNSAYRFYLQPASGSQTGMIIKPSYSGQTAPYLTISAPSGHSYFNFTSGGHLQIGGGTSGADVDLYRSAANTLKVSGSLEIGTLYLTDGSVKQVVVGAADSAGTGYKLLRVAN